MKQIGSRRVEIYILMGNNGTLLLCTSKYISWLWYALCRDGGLYSATEDTNNKQTPLHSVAQHTQHQIPYSLITQQYTLAWSQQDCRNEMWPYVLV